MKLARATRRRWQQSAARLLAPQGGWPVGWTEPCTRRRFAAIGSCYAIRLAVEPRGRRSLGRILEPGDLALPPFGPGTPRRLVLPTLECSFVSRLGRPYRLAPLPRTRSCSLPAPPLCPAVRRMSRKWVTPSWPFAWERRIRLPQGRSGRMCDASGSSLKKPKSGPIRRGAPAKTRPIRRDPRMCPKTLGTRVRAV
jgi:hypothetical protein